jgi:hypothetical protein
MTERRSILQWNMGCGALTDVTPSVMDSRLRILRSLLSEHMPSIVALQEAPTETSALLRLAGFAAYDSGALLLGMRNTDWTKGRTVLRQTRVFTVEVQLAAERTLLVSDVHLRSRRNSQQLDRENGALAVLTAIRDLRGKYVNRVCSEIIVGDFNLNPHDGIMMMSEGFYANRSKAFVRNRAKNSVAPKRPMYNPAWHIYGRAEEPLGSLYSTTPYDGPWLVFDQVLMSADLIGADSCEIAVVTDANGVSLLSASVVKLPDKRAGSDHLPLVSTFVV